MVSWVSEGAVEGVLWVEVVDSMRECAEVSGWSSCPGKMRSAGGASNLIHCIHIVGTNI